jgi:hypothetical protein
VIKKFIGGTYKRQWKHEEELINNAYAAAPRASESVFSSLAILVQARWRTVLFREEYRRWQNQQRWPIYWVAAATIQRAWADYQYLRNRNKLKNRSKRFYTTKIDSAAAKIQLMWRSCVNRRVFRFLMSLIRFREQGDPSLMLKCIDTGESSLMDKASGLHVRFRLGGTTFPPQILYKVFTHNNVADICAFAPKDYAENRRKTVSGKARCPHNKSWVAPERDRSRWYQRVDNNFWRPVDSAVLKNAEEWAARVDQSATRHADIIAQGAPFHYSRLVRQQDRELRSKLKRRMWLAELYSDEQIRQKKSVPPQSIREEAYAIFKSMEDEQISEEIKRLTEWTEHLDYEAYRRDWLAIATTAPSDAKTVV